jgi:hypothetical protein
VTISQKALPSVINETVLAARDFLNRELAKYETWGICQRAKSYLTNLLDRNLSEGKFSDMRQHGVGQSTILKFLGGNWKQWMVQEGLLYYRRTLRIRRVVDRLFPFSS